jgi:hypothetical protein
MGNQPVKLQIERTIQNGFMTLRTARIWVATATIAATIVTAIVTADFMSAVVAFVVVCLCGVIAVEINVDK